MSYIICLFLFCYIVPCSVIFLSYLFILLTVRGAQKAVQQHVSPQNKITNAQTLIVKVGERAQREKERERERECVSVCVMSGVTLHLDGPLWTIYRCSDYKETINFRLG